MTETKDDWDDPEAFKKARDLWHGDVSASKSKRKARKAREKQIKNAVDGRTLRATGRTAQFNFKCKQSIKDRAHEAAELAGLSIAIWMERAILAALGDDGGWND